MIFDYYDYMDYIKAAVGIKYKDGTIRVITVYEKGYPGFTGALLLAKYQKQEKIEQLLELGDIERLGEELNPNSNFPHYIIIEGDKTKKELQERVTVAQYRDIRINVDGILTKQKKQEYEEYSSEKDIYNETGVKYVYIFNSSTKCWKTYSLDFKVKKFKSIKIKYRGLINNLVDGEDIEDLTKEEKQYLARFNY